VKSRYAEGRSGIIELADAQNDELQAQSDLANALYDLLLARASYDKARGRQLW
jgi:outer membrane protein TolC